VFAGHETVLVSKSRFANGVSFLKTIRYCVKVD
jgi:hypothetical protein